MDTSRGTNGAVRLFVARLLTLTEVDAGGYVEISQL